MGNLKAKDSWQKRLMPQEEAGGDLSSAKLVKETPTDDVPGDVEGEGSGLPSLCQALTGSHLSDCKAGCLLSFLPCPRKAPRA